MAFALAWAGLLAVTGDARAATPVDAGLCFQGMVSTGDPTSPAGRVLLCNEALQQILDKLARDGTGTDQRLRELESLLKRAAAAGSAAGLGSASQVDALAGSLALRLREADQGRSAASLREIRRLTDQVDELAERLAEVREKPAGTRVTASVQAELAKAVTELDFREADRLLDGIARIQQTVEGTEVRVKRIEAGVDRMSDGIESTQLLAVVSELGRTRPTSDNGQLAAIAALSRRGHGFSGQDFDAVHLAGLVAPGLQATDASLFLARLDGSSLAGANFERVRLVAASMKEVDLSRARLQESRAPFVVAEGARLAGADLTRAVWVGANLKGADLRGANLNRAHLQYADLRGANLEGADLRGAFLANVDLRGARLAGARFEQTEVYGALIELTGLKPEQLGGLCATSFEPTQRWRVVEESKATNANGIPYREELVRYPLAMGRDAGRPYASCGLRPDGSFNAWNRPVVRLQRGEAIGGFMLWVSSDILDLPGRRAAFRQRLDAVIARSTDHTALLQELPQFAVFSRQADSDVNARLAELTRNLKPADRLFFDRDTALLVAQRLAPRVVEALGIDWTALARTAGYSSDLGKPPRRPDWQSPWPRLLPDKLSSADLTPATTAAFRRWTLRRSEALATTRVWMQGRSPSGRSPRSLVSILGGVVPKSVGLDVEQLTADLGVPVERLVVLKSGLLELGESRNLPEVFVLLSPLESLTVDDSSFRRGTGGFVEIEVTGLRQTRIKGRTGDREVLVWLIRGRG